VEIPIYNTSTKRSLNQAPFDKISKSGMMEVVEVLCIIKREYDKLIRTSSTLKVGEITNMKQ
jgi:hypothetical protein